jgi:hypothetical protein
MTEIYIYTNPSTGRSIVIMGDCIAPRGYKLSETKMIYSHKPVQDLLKFITKK